jgi:hypothetical protein
MGFSGVILEARTLENQSIPFYRRAGLECWLDVSNLSHEPLRGWHLQVAADSVVVTRNEDEAIDWYNPETVPWLTHWLEHRTEHITGVLWKEAAREYSSAYPPFPWSPFLPSHFASSTLDALVSSTGKEAARWRQDYWNALEELRGKQIQSLSEWCAQHHLQFAAALFRPEWHALGLDSNLRARLQTALVRNKPGALQPVVLQGEMPAEHLRDSYEKLLAGASHFEIALMSQHFNTGTLLCDEAIARATGELSSTKSAARVGVLFPSRSAQIHYHPDGHRFTRWVGEDLAAVTKLLNELHFDWTFVFEEDLFPAEYSLELIVVSGVTALSTDTWQAIESFVDDGGKAACLGLLPRWSQQGRDAAFEKRVGNAALVEIDELYTAYAALEAGDKLPPTIGFPVFREHPSGGRLCCYQPKLNEDAEDAALRVRQILHESLAADFETQNRNIFYTHRGKPGVSQFLLLNSSEVTQQVNARLVPPAPTRSITIYDAVNNQRSALPVWMAHSSEIGAGVSVSLELTAGQALIVSTSDETESPHLERANFHVESFDGNSAVGYATENVLPRCAVRDGGKLSWHIGRELHLPLPLLLPADEWSFIPHGAYDEYSQEFACREDWQDCRMFVEIAGAVATIEVLLNGRSCGTKFTAPWRFDITSQTSRDVANNLGLHISPSQAEPQELFARLVAYPEVIIEV